MISRRKERGDPIEIRKSRFGAVERKRKSGHKESYTIILRVPEILNYACLFTCLHELGHIYYDHWVLLHRHKDKSFECENDFTWEKESPLMIGIQEVQAWKYAISCIKDDYKPLIIRFAIGHCLTNRLDILTDIERKIIMSYFLDTITLAYPKVRIIFKQVIDKYFAEVISEKSFIKFPKKGGK